jgi:hypothetical protein
MAYLLKRRDGRDIAKKRYCPVQKGTYGQPSDTTYSGGNLPFQRNMVTPGQKSKPCRGQYRGTERKDMPPVSYANDGW